jgi:hypothetical protein
VKDNSLPIKKEKAKLIRELLGANSYFYDSINNVMRDENGNEVLNIFEIISPNMLWLFKMKKHDMLVYSLKGKFVELLYPAN